MQTQLLKSYLLVPGASWSQLKQGDEVVLTGRLANGWFRCMAKMDVAASTEQGLDYSHLTDTHEHTPGHGQQSGLLYVYVRCKVRICTILGFSCPDHLIARNVLRKLRGFLHASS